MDTSHQCLVDEIKRQIRFLEPNPSENQRAQQKKKYPGIIDARQQNADQRYRTDLLALLLNLTSDSSQSKAGSKPPLHLNNLSLFWQIPAFCGDAIVIDQNYAKDRSKALQDLRAAKDTYTADIWERRELTKWISGAKPSVLVVQGTSQSVERLEKFSVELVDYLQGRCPTVFLLSSLPAFYENSFSRGVSRGDAVLRQIAGQCLRIIPSSVKDGALSFLATDGLSFLAKTTSHFQTASHEDWFSSIEASLSHQVRVYIVLDISILRQHFRDAFSWPAEFSNLIHRLRSRRKDLRVMILTGRSIDGELGATTRIMSVDMAPQPPPQIHDLSESEKRSVLLSQLRNSQVQTSLLASMSNTETTKERSVRNSTPADLINGNRKEERQNLVEGTHRSGLGSFQAADSGVTEGSPIPWFRNLTSKTHAAIYSSRSAKDNSFKPVKIAVLDTGFAYTEEHDKKSLKPYMHRIKKFASFVEDETDLEAMKDPSGHGTAVAVQMLKVSLSAVLYICRVATSSKDGSRELFPDKEAVERAIRKAVAEPEKGGWGVDIVNMSFGWAFDDHDGVRNAIRFARRQGVHMFASTSNDGLLGPPNDILYPSRAPEVIAIDAADGFGEYTRTTASSVSSYGSGRRFSAPGTRLTSPHSAALFDGSSFACAIAAGIGALVLEFARQSPLQASTTVQNSLKEMSAMIAILERMSAEKGPDRFKFLLPWTLLGKPGQPREFTAYSLVDELRNEFGLAVGSEVFPLEGES
ncbi:Subtilisin DY [Trichoderma lentiforme]|uniref:Subtilisin DY n=1 Tax=Trichoderma lentiforme TaxID=1567552 RepID=A0A9P4XLH4_9HYPO|nr:Subtilisin DY [Trichoderma lentiforme]